MIYYERHGVTVHHGDCLPVLRTLPDASIDAVCSDPPYGLAEHRPAALVTALTGWATGDRERVPDGRGFMGKDWDRFVPPPAVWDECLRVLKPGGHLVAFAGSRTQDLMGLSIRMAGFEIRDGLSWLMGSGFPKSLSVHKATLSKVDSRYGTARCDCLDAGDGRATGDDLRQGGSDSTRVRRGAGPVPAAQAGYSDVPLDPRPSEGPVRELWGDCGAEGARSDQVEAAVLFDDMRGGGSEATRLGHAEVRTRLEEHPGESASAGSGLPGVRSAADGRSAARPSHEALPVRRDESANEPGGAVRVMSSRDRGRDDLGPGVDRDRREARRTHSDDHGGRHTAVARICSWCGLPDPGWLDGLVPFGTALKPGHEPILLARKPLVGTVAENVGGHGTGALNVDGCRVTTADALVRPSILRTDNQVFGKGLGAGAQEEPAGRWPANVLLTHSPLAWHALRCDVSQDAAEAILAYYGVGQGVRALRDGVPGVAVRGDAAPRGECRLEVRSDLIPPGWADLFEYVGEACKDACAPGCPVAELDAQSGVLTSGANPTRRGSDKFRDAYGEFTGQTECVPARGKDSGGASRFFPTFRYQAKAPARERPKVDGVAHPTVKPLELMRWLVRLVTPPGGVVLDPFAGSGTTGQAANLEGLHAVLIEREPAYLPLIAARLDGHPRTTEAAPVVTADEPLDLFDLLGGEAS